MKESPQSISQGERPLLVADPQARALTLSAALSSSPATLASSLNEPASPTSEPVSRLDHITLPDDARVCDPRNVSEVGSLFANLALDAPFIKRLTVVNPTLSQNNESSPLLQFDLEESIESRQTDYNVVRDIDPIPARSLQILLAACTNLEELVWLSSTPPPDGICEMLSVHNSKLTNCSFGPFSRSTRIGLHVSLPSNIPRWDAPSLGHLFVLPLTSLRITRLSQNGARSLCELLTKLGEYSNLEHVSLDFLWLDDALCEALALAGRKLRSVQIGTVGTKLSDKGITSIIENCDLLAELSLVEVQGRLSRNLWSKIEDAPLSLRTVRVSMSEAGPHHSWTADHLASISQFPLEDITQLSIIRSASLSDTEVDDMAVPKPVPAEFLSQLKESATSLTTLECDWWSWSPTDVKQLVEENPDLEVIQILLDAPISKLFGLANVFASALRLRTLRVSVPLKYAPEVAAATTTQIGLVTPASSPLINTRGFSGRPDTSPTKSNASLPNSQLPPTPPTSPLELFSPTSPITGNTSAFSTAVSIPASTTTSTDSYVPNPRDVLKFSRRCPKLESIEWYGRNGRGTWLVYRDGPTNTSQSTATSAKSNGVQNLVRIDHIQPTASEDRTHVYDVGAIEREGHEWTGPAAIAHAELVLAEKEEQAAAAVVEPTHTSPKKNIPLAPINTTSSARRRPSAGALSSLSPTIGKTPSSSPVKSTRHGSTAGGPDFGASPTKASSRSDSKRRGSASNGTSGTDKVKSFYKADVRGKLAGSEEGTPKARSNGNKSRSSKRDRQLAV